MFSDLLWRYIAGDVSFFSFGLAEDELLEANMQKLRETNGAQKILDCCLSRSLPVLAELEKNQATFLSVAGKNSLQTVAGRSAAS